MKKKPLVLVVDDEISITDVLTQYINVTQRYRSCVAHNGLEALEQLKKHSKFLGLGGNEIMCVVLDIKMPVMDGLQFLSELRRGESFYQLMPVILLSAYEDSEKWVKATSPTTGNVAEYLTKPVKHQVLIDAIDRIHQGEGGYMIDYTREKKRAERLALLAR